MDRLKSTHIALTQDNLQRGHKNCIKPSKIVKPLKIERHYKLIRKVHECRILKQPTTNTAMFWTAVKNELPNILLPTFGDCITSNSLPFEYIPECECEICPLYPDILSNKNPMETSLIFPNCSTTLVLDDTILSSQKFNFLYTNKVFTYSIASHDTNPEEVWDKVSANDLASCQLGNDNVIVALDDILLLTIIPKSWIILFQLADILLEVAIECTMVQILPLQFDREAETTGKSRHRNSVECQPFQISLELADSVCHILLTDVVVTLVRRFCKNFLNLGVKYIPAVRSRQFIGDVWHKRKIVKVVRFKTGDDTNDDVLVKKALWLYKFNKHMTAANMGRTHQNRSTSGRARRQRQNLETNVNRTRGLIR